MGHESLALSAVALLTLGAVFYVVGRHGWRDYEIYDSGGTILGRLLAWSWESPVAWTLGFVLLAGGIGAAAVVVVSEGALVSVGAGTVLPVVLGGIGLLVAGYLFLGTYFSIRSRGTTNSVAAALSAIFMGFVLLAVIFLRLAGFI